MNLKTLTLLALLTTPAWPATITFGWFGTPGFTSGGTNSITVNNAAGISGLTLTVTAGVLAPNSCSSQCWITSSFAGYGVDNAAPAGGTSDSSTDIDGSGADDYIVLEFNRRVILMGATFGNFGSSDDGALFNLTEGTNITFDTSSITGLDEHGTLFRFQATGTNDAYRLRSIEFVQNPEPGTMGLIGLGLVGLVIADRKRRRWA